MLFCFVLFCSVLFCLVLLCFVLFCSVLFCCVLVCSVMFRSIISQKGSEVYKKFPNISKHSQRWKRMSHIPWSRFIIAQKGSKYSQTMENNVIYTVFQSLPGLHIKEPDHIFFVSKVYQVYI